MVGTDTTEQLSGDSTDAAPSSGRGEPAVHLYCAAKPIKRQSVQLKETKKIHAEYPMPISSQFKNISYCTYSLYHIKVKSEC